MIKDLTIVIPCLNEEKTIGVCIEKCLKMAYSSQCGDISVIVVDNGSTDNSVQIALEHGAKVVHCADKGYGSALRCGFAQVETEWLLMGDADNTYDFLEIPKLCNAVQDATDMVIGTRLKGYIEKGAMPFLNRYLGTPVLTTLLNILYKTNISDCMCGMRLIKTNALKQIDFTTTGMEFASELLVEFSKHKFNIKEVPISLYKSIDGRKPHLRPWRDGFRHLVYLLKAYLS